MAHLPRLFLGFALVLLASGCAVLPALEPAPRQTVLDAPVAPSLSFTMSDGMVLPARGVAAAGRGAVARCDPGAARVYR